MGRATHLYLIEVITYGITHPIKIGIAANIEKRMRQLKQMGINCPSLLGYFTFEKRSEAQRIETAAHHHFPVCPKYGHYSHEIHDVEFDVALSFLVPLVGDRPFHRPQA